MGKDVVRIQLKFCAGKVMALGKLIQEEWINAAVITQTGRTNQTGTAELVRTELAHQSSV